MFSGDEIMLISDQGTMVRTRGDEVSVVGRNTQGVRIIRLKENENLVSLARIAEPEEDEFAVSEGDEDAAEASAQMSKVMSVVRTAVVGGSNLMSEKDPLLC